ncbi:ABC transporter permease subunit [Sphaerisporangium krabiense]|uniref:ABC-type transport system involved in multi-copper enzyme maturation permease subunit n=1 Tax=Sphaerisporangium krabiense TaxID=763782 RepID=A0A7W8Z2E4_9ACTN|nr:ABC transporter permease subunit [Sphaerisporangium krabiense]MBB5625918.1 ABC-type transport system involved in multi-copper enzyme maturation permease subunit [Sphaerisporangium krabiense]
MTRYRSAQRAGRDGFLQVLHAEWTKFRSVRGWVLAMVAVAPMVVLVALLAGVSSDQRGAPAVPVGPGGAPVTDSFYFVHRPLTGDGGITVSVSALRSAVPTGPADLRPGSVPWAKAGLIIKESTRQGSPYAAIMVTGGHGVRMQHGYVGGTAGIPGPVSAASPRRLRLDRSGDAITGYASADGTHWTKMGTVHVDGLGPTAQGGPFVASPPSVEGMGTVPSVSTADFGDLRVQGGWAGGDWTGDQVGAESPSFSGYPRNTSGSFTWSDGRFTVTGAGDIAPALRQTLPTGGTLADILTGTFAALIAVIVVGAQFVTAEYRDGTICTTLAAVPRRGRVLAAKAVVLGAVTFVAGLVGAVVAVPLGERLARAHGVYLFPVTFAAHSRIAFGTAALLATAAILALAAGAVFRRGAAAVTGVVAVLVLPYLLVAQVPFLPADVSNRLARVTPAAAFAVQQTLVPYHQVTSIYTPYDGYYPLAPWAGYAVLAGYAVAGLVLAAVVLRRRDA